MIRRAATGLFIAALLTLSPAIALADSNASVEASVRTYFAATPVMINIASCESQFHQFNTDGSVLHGGYKHTMIGIFQIAPLHLKDARARGYDLDTIAGNMAYAKWLYEVYGTSPWLDSSPCWGAMSIGEDAGDHPTATVSSGDATSAKIAMLEQQLAHMSAVLNAMLAAQATS